MFGYIVSANPQGVNDLSSVITSGGPSGIFIEHSERDYAQILQQSIVTNPQIRPE